MCSLHFRGVEGLNPGKVDHLMYKWKLFSLLVVRIHTEELLNKEVTRLHIILIKLILYLDTTLLIIKTEIRVFNQT